MKYILTLTLLLGLCKTLLAAPRTLQIAWESPPRTVDPRYVTDADSRYLEELTHCSLIAFNVRGEVIPSLASSWSWRDAKTLIVKIRTDLTFSDGQLVTLDDVAETYSALTSKKLKTPSPRQPAFAGVAKIDKNVAENSLTFYLKEPDVSLISNLMVGILPKKYAQEPTPLQSPPPGCGPYVITEKKFHHLFLKARAPETEIQNIEIKIVRDESTRLSKLKRGELDIVQNALSRLEVRKIESEQDKPNSRLRVLKNVGISTHYIGFNFRDGTLKNLAVRRAINLAIDRENLMRYGLEGYAVPARSLLPPQDPFFDKAAETPRFAPAEAEKILDEAGFTGKPRLKISLMTTQSQTRAMLAHGIASNLRKIGIETQVKVVEWGRFKSEIESGQAQMWILNWVGFKDPDLYRFVFSSKTFPPNGANRGFYENTQLDPMLEAARSETNITKRKTLYQNIQRFVAQELPYVLLWHEQFFAVVRKDLQGFEVAADGSYLSLVKAKFLESRMN